MTPRFLQGGSQRGSGKTRLDDLLWCRTNRDRRARHVEVIRSHQQEAASLSPKTRAKPDRIGTIHQGRSALAQEVIASVKGKLNSEFGIELLDFRFKRINYTEKVRQEIFKRMISAHPRASSSAPKATVKPQKSGVSRNAS